MSFFGLLFIVLLTLKLMGIISIGWGVLLLILVAPLVFLAVFGLIAYAVIALLE